MSEEFTKPEAGVLFIALERSAEGSAFPDLNDVERSAARKLAKIASPPQSCRIVEGALRDD